MSSAQDDLALIARLKRELPQRHEAFEELVRKYQSRMYTLCYRLSGNAADADDLLQEILLRLYTSIHTFDGRAAFSTWLFRVVHNHCLTALKRRKRRLDRDGELEIEPADPRTLPQPREGRAQRALNRMGAEERALLVMKYVTELEVTQIAQVLSIGESAAKMRLLRARELFKQIYGELT